MLNFTLGLRRLVRDRLFASINIGGLAVGIAGFLLITLYLRQELSFESHHANADRIYRIALTVRPSDGNPPIAMASNAPLVAPLLQEDFPEVEASTRLAVWQPSVRVTNGEPMHMSALLADNSISDLFDFNWLAGDARTALVEPASVVLTAGAAKRLFGRIDVLGEVVVMAGVPDARVSGVVADPLVTTHLQFDLLVPMALAPAVFTPNALQNWSGPRFHTYIMLRQGADIAALETQFASFMAQHLDAEASRVLVLDAMPLRDVHLHSNRVGELGRPGSMVAVSAFGVVAVIVLLLACINFMNLATAKAAQRGREVGVRKAMGAARLQLVRQFFAESLLLSALAAVLALVLVEMVLPFFNTLLQQQLTLRWSAPMTWLSLAAVTMVAGICAGLYPALYISAQKPNLALRGLFAGGKAGGYFRNMLVVLQFSAAIALLVCTATVFRQVNHAQRQDVGYEREQVLVLSNLGRDGVGRQWDAMKQQLLAVPGVAQVTAMNNAPTQDSANSYFLNFEGGLERRSMPTMLTDTAFFDTFAIQFVAGQGFGTSAGDAQGSYVLSEDAARRLGWTPQQALGKWLELTCCGMPRGIVTGVVADVLFGSARSAMGPMLYVVPPDPQTLISSETRLGLQQIAIRLQGADVQASLAGIEQVWKQFRADQPLTRSFVSDNFAALYAEEIRQGNMLIAFALLAIFITCLGLYGLATFNAQRRTKEIGVRKVMGGGVWSIVLLLTNDFSRLVLLSNLIAWPIAYVAMQRWLENFAYRVDLAPVVFIGSGLIALCVAWATVGSTAAKAASAKPVLALRYE